MAAKYLEIARKAKQTASELQTSKYDQCRAPGNALLYFFLRYARWCTATDSATSCDGLHIVHYRRDLRLHLAETQRDMALSLGKARSSVKDHPIRLWNQDMLGKVTGVGRVTVKARAACAVHACMLGLGRLRACILCCASTEPQPITCPSAKLRCIQTPDFESLRLAPRLATIHSWMWSRVGLASAPGTADCQGIGSYRAAPGRQRLLLDGWQVMGSHTSSLGSKRYSVGLSLGGARLRVSRGACA
jgi:hypothetical protein